jgi:hypothetical protein
MIYFCRISKRTNEKELNNLKIFKEKTFKEDGNTKKNYAYQNVQSKILTKSNIEATLSFLSSLSCKYFWEIYQ